MFENSLKTTPARFMKFAGYLHWEVGFSGSEISLILKNEMAAAVSSLKIAKHKNAYISKTVLDRAISTEFLTNRVSLRSSYPNFQKIFVSPKNGGHFEFSAKIAKHKNAYISKTVLDRAILAKILTHRVSLRRSYPIFEKIFISPKMAAILNFRIFHKNCKT